MLSNVDYVSRMEQTGTWGDGVMVAAAARVYDRQIIVVVADDSGTVLLPISSTKEDRAKQLYVGYLPVVKHLVHLEPTTNSSITGKILFFL